MTNHYRLIWFQHFHKAAGSFIVSLARSNQEVLYPQNTNGNPRDTDGTLIRLWEMSNDELTQFVDHCENKGITFVATEWGAPNFRLLASDPRVTIITCLRDPSKRFLSNFYYDVRRGYTHCKSIDEYVNSGGSFTMFNYYCRILTQHNENPELITTSKFEEAKSLLSFFDYLVILENQETFCKLNQFLGWNEQAKRQNELKLRIRRIFQSIKSRKHTFNRQQSLDYKEKPNQKFLEVFHKLNKFDNQLYLSVKNNHLLDSSLKY